MPTEILHGPAQLAADLPRHEVAMESFCSKRAGYGTVRTDEPEIKPQLLGDRQRECVPASSDQYDFDAGIMGATQGSKVVVGNLKLWIEQRPVDIGGQQADRTRERLHHLQF